MCVCVCLCVCVSVCVLQHIVNGNEVEVERLLSEGESNEDVRMCHPLCSCDLCDLQLSGSAYTHTHTHTHTHTQLNKMPL